jgi:predicted phage terminase large subunit-like protein
MNSWNNWPPVCGTPRYHHAATILGTRSLARIDPSLFLRWCFTDPQGRPIEQAAVHDRLQAFLSQHPRALVELPRDHGKSFQVCGRILWELGRNPALRVKVVCATEAVAAERSRFLRDAITRNIRVRSVFPQLRPAQPWTPAAFTIQRPAEVIGPSVAAFGIGTGSTGTRADLLVCDDVVDVRSLASKAHRDRVADYFANNLMNLLEPDGRFWGLFTPWHLDDLNARLKRTGAYALFREAVGPNLEPVWPEKWPTERLQARKAEIGAASFARGYHLVPLAEDDTPIRAEWVQFWTEPRPCDRVILAVDPAVSTASSADRSALVVLGQTRADATELALGGEAELTADNWPEFGSASELRVLAAVARRVATPELITLIEVFDRHWNPAVILFESNAAFRGLRDVLARHAVFGPKLKSVTTSTDKAARIAAFSVVVENGRFRLKGNGRGQVDHTQRDLFDEMVTFPFGEHDDLLDAAAMGCAALLDRREPRVW